MQAALLSFLGIEVSKNQLEEQDQGKDEGYKSGDG
jgi:hypothetical protein